MRKYWNRDYGKRLRNLILKNCAIKQIINFGDSGVFRDVTNYPCILIFEKGRVEANVFKCVKVLSPIPNLLIEIRKEIGKSEHPRKYELFGVNQSALSDDIWKLAPKTEEELIRKIKQKADSTLKDICDEIYEGFITGANPIYFPSPETMQKFEFEKGILKPVPKGQDVKKWMIKWKGRYVIYPHKSSAGKTLPIESLELKSKYQKTWKYFETYRARLEKREYLMNAIRKGQRQEWYEIWNPRNLDWFEQLKIITPNLSTKNNFALDEKGYFLDHDCYGIILKNKDRSHYLFVLALLNSKVLEFYLKQISPYASGKYFRYMTGYLGALPIKILPQREGKRVDGSITQKVDQIIQLNKELDELEEKIGKFPESYFGGGKLVNVAEKCELSKDKYNVKSLALEPVKKAGKELYKLALMKEDYVLFSARAMAECALEQLKRKTKVRIDEIHDLKIPSEKDASRVMDEFSNDKKRVKEIRKEAEKLEREIDQLVYELYGLNAKDREVIEEFLKKF